MTSDGVPDDLVARVSELQAELDGLADPRARGLAAELVGAVIAMYGDGLARVMAVLDEAGAAGAAVRDALLRDGSVSSLLLIHDLYPIPLEERVAEALATVRPYMASHGGDVELLGLEDGVARLALRGSCNGCAASRATLELAIKQALDEHAPDLAGLDVQGVSETSPSGRRPRFSLELPVLHADGALDPVAAAEPPSRWVPLTAAEGLEPGEMHALDADGVTLLVANIGGTLLAYVDACAACGEPLHGGALDGGMLRCRACAVDYDLPRAGRAAGGGPLQLRPVPLLEAGGVRVAV
jgi:Fe-S cluster biogenesis protein NfuA/nitrite reductase/ring-hydroxylating ferredoxin subunit